jgi:hypothetical protein
MRGTGESCPKAAVRGERHQPQTPGPEGFGIVDWRSPTMGERVSPRERHDGVPPSRDWRSPIGLGFRQTTINAFFAGMIRFARHWRSTSVENPSRPLQPVFNLNLNAVRAGPGILLHDACRSVAPQNRNIIVCSAISAQSLPFSCALLRLGSHLGPGGHLERPPGGMSLPTPSDSARRSRRPRTCRWRIGTSLPGHRDRQPE